VNAFISSYKLEKAKFHGCALGLTNDKGEPIKKPWTIATDDEEVYFEMIKFQCKHNPGDHGECRGKTAADSASYTDDMTLHWQPLC
jgi:hypothetical protein